MTPTSSRHRSVEGYLSVCDEGTVNSVVRVADAAQVAACGLFWKYSRGKNYRAEGCVFWVTFIIYTTAAAQSVYRQIKIEIDLFTNVYHTWNVYLQLQNGEALVTSQTTRVSARTYNTAEINMTTATIDYIR